MQGKIYDPSSLLSSVICPCTRLLRSSKVFMLSASKPPANWKSRPTDKLAHFIRKFRFHKKLLYGLTSQAILLQY